MKRPTVTRIVKSGTHSIHECKPPSPQIDPSKDKINLNNTSMQTSVGLYSGIVLGAGE